MASTTKWNIHLCNGTYKQTLVQHCFTELKTRTHLADSVTFSTSLARSSIFFWPYRRYTNCGATQTVDKKCLNCWVGLGFYATTHTHTHIYTHTHTTHRHRHTHTHKNTHTHRHTQTHTYTHTQTHIVHWLLHATQTPHHTTNTNTHTHTHSTPRYTHKHTTQV